MRLLLTGLHVPNHRQGERDGVFEVVVDFVHRLAERGIPESIP